MGYSHYWQFTGKIAPKELKDGEARFANAVKLIKVLRKEVEKRGVELAGGLGEGEPTINDSLVWLNGKGKDAHETFRISIEDGEWDFCKTDRKPYDVMVCLCLLAFKDAFGEDFSYTSDGITREEYENRENNEYWKKIGFVPEGPEKEWQAAYDIWDKVTME